MKHLPTRIALEAQVIPVASLAAIPQTKNNLSTASTKLAPKTTRLKLTE